MSEFDEPTPDLETLLEEGANLLDRGDPALAARCFEHALAIDPDDPDALLLLGIAQWRLGRSEEAALRLRRAAEVCPGHPQALLHWGRFATEARWGDVALPALRTLVEIAPSDPAGWSALADACVRLRSTPDGLREARAATARAAALAPDDPAMHLQRGRIEGLCGDHHAAAICFERVLRLRSDGGTAGAARDAEVRLLAASAYANAGDRDAARVHAGAATAGTPAAETVLGLALLHHALEDSTAADLAFEQAIERSADAGHPPLAIELARSIARLPAVPDSAEDADAAHAAFGRSILGLRAAQLDSSTGGPVDPAGLLQPFHLPALGGPNRAALSAYGDLVADRAPVGAIPRTDRPRIRVGIVSGLFHDHVVAHLLIDGWSARLDRGLVEVIGFHTGSSRDGVTERLAGQCDRFIAGPRPPQGWIEALCAAECDALLYPEIGMDPLAGFLARRRLAPLQALAWGHPETSGLPTIDAFLSSDLMEPPESTAHYRETLVRLPGLGAWIRRPPAHAAPAPHSPDTPPTLWLAQTPHKHHPRFDPLLGRIAAALPDHRLCFSAHPGAASTTERFTRRLAAALAEAGADPRRQLRILPRLSRDAFLAELSAARLFLDPPGWSGGHTTLEAIALGIPPVTLPGPLMRQRHALGILRAIDGAGDLIRELVVPDEATYLDRVVALAADDDRRAAVERSLRAKAPRAFEDDRPIRALEQWIVATLAERGSG